jgi:mxaJ protein
MSSASSRRAFVLVAIALLLFVAAAARSIARRPSITASASAQPARPSEPLTPITAAVPPPPPLHDPHDLWVCADPNNMPFSDAKGQGFENQIAALVARDLGRHLRYFWEPQRRGFIRTTLKAGNCDVVISAPAGSGLVEPTRPYYTSTYVFVYRRGQQHPALTSFDDGRLKRMRIGIQMVGEDYGNPPPAQALAARQLADNVRGFTVYGDYSQGAPQRAIIDAVASGEVDTAVVWGPLAGYFARSARRPLEVVPVAPVVDRSGTPFTFEMVMGVRPGAVAFRAQLDDFIERRIGELHAILRRYNVPLVEESSQP